MVGKRHNLPLINIFDKDAQVLPRPRCSTSTAASTPRSTAAYQPNTPAWTVRGAQADRRRLRGRRPAGEDRRPRPESAEGDRSGTVIEPWLTDQWFVSTKPLAEKPSPWSRRRNPAVPKQWENMYFSWMRDIQDWCISRQLGGATASRPGTTEAGNVYVGRDERGSARPAQPG